MIPNDHIKLDADGRTLLILKDGRWEKWQRFDPETDRFYKMIYVNDGAPPTVEISGIKMHVTQNSDPAADTQRKLSALGKVRGLMLDTCCGLGYTASALASQAQVERVMSIERDPNMLALCRDNPWSQDVFSSPKIELLTGDSVEILSGLPDGILGGILHDPPRFSLSPGLYTDAFYRDCHRAMQAGGRMYHYTGDPNRHSRRKSLPERTAERLRTTGFRHVRLAYQGVSAQK